MMKPVTIVLSACLTVGCSALTRPKEKPVIEDRVSEHSEKTIGILATTPERRVVLVKMPDHKFCAEPPADAAENVSSAISAAAEAAITGQLDKAQVDVASSLATSVQQLFVRSQGIQLFRDGTFMLCTAYLNGAITAEQYADRQQKLLETVVPLITAEIPHLRDSLPPIAALPAEPKPVQPAPAAGQ